MRTQSKITVKAWQSPGILLEKYDYTSGTVEPLPKHSHDEYQLGLSFNCQGEYYYRGSYNPIPIGSLSIIHSGEVHSPSQRNSLPTPVSFLMMHVDSNLLKTITSEIACKRVSFPFFPQVSIRDRQIISMFQELYIPETKRLTKLERDSLILDLFASLIILHAQERPSIQIPKIVKPAIARVRDFIQCHYADNLSLKELANIAGLSSYYLSRSFSRGMGVSLSAYQMQIRIDQAKKLLAQGKPIVMIASEIGFYDQSHFALHFKRLVGTTPGNYKKEQ
ncbi:helix-turn-helix domain-containing protein [Mastigocoleus testarum]|uniref:HTH araC/xylS-type domain-containing protein n=1 Tax=Mastigocoleus testarum BC008 TaxID=371196 RepID=A0A0V7ZXN3_9CYAN|nr:AraC family transcriptional regulator [Mastigocoleus testarum]KST63709.1 hypothetical protein BC008_14720 [Mastigocoleus testarum BC008]KST69227.1 hypothetical protein BC008_03295 [Mastigocoleus testarum BC008]